MCLYHSNTEVKLHNCILQEKAADIMCYHFKSIKAGHMIKITVQNKKIFYIKFF